MYASLGIGFVRGPQSPPQNVFTNFDPSYDTKMRGLVLKEPTPRLPLFQATALVLVSARNGLSSGGASDSEAPSDQTSGSSYEEDSTSVVDLLNPKIALRNDIATGSLFDDTLNSWFNPNVISTVATQVAVPSGSNRNHSDADGEPLVKKPRFSTDHELESFVGEAMSLSLHPQRSPTREDRTLEDAFALLKSPATDVPDQHCNIIKPTQSAAQVDMVGTAQHVVSANTALINGIEFMLAPVQEPLPILEQCEDWGDLSAWLAGLTESPTEGAAVGETFDCDVVFEDAVLDQQVASFAEPAHVTSAGTAAIASAAAPECTPASTPTVDTNTTNQLNEEGRQDEIGDEELSLPRSIGTSLTSLANCSSEASQDHLLVGASHNVTSTDHSEPRCDEEDASEQTPESSLSIPSAASTSDPSVSQILNWSEPPTGKKLYKCLGKALNEGKIKPSDAAQQLLLSSCEVMSFRKNVMDGTRKSLDMEDAPFLSSSWLLKRLVLQDKVPAYSLELQMAFECYGYDDVSIPDLRRRALDLGYTVRHLCKARISDPKLVDLRGDLILFALATEIVRDAFFKDRALRSDLNIYLRNKLKTHESVKAKLGTIPGCLRECKGDMKRLKVDLRFIKKAINPKASTGHPLEFTSFLGDVCTLVRSDGKWKTSQSAGESSASQSAGESSASTDERKERRRSTELKRVIAILTKYKKLFEIDLDAELKVLLKEAPAEDGHGLFEKVVEEGWIPFDLLRPEFIYQCGAYSISAHCLLGSITALYRRLFDNSSPINELESDDTEKTRSGLKAREVNARDGRPKLDVVQEYLLQPLPTTSQGSKLTIEEFDPLSAAAEVLEMCKQDLNSFPSIPDIPDDVVSLIRPYAPFGTPQWTLSQLLHDHCPEEHQWRHNELQFALDLCGYGSVDIKNAFAKALVLAAAVLTKHNVPFDDSIKQVNLLTMSRAYVLAADILHAALFHTWTQRQDLTEYFAKQLKYKVLPQHKECVREVVAKRAEWHPRMTIRFQRGDKELVADWCRLRMAKAASMEDVEVDHPLSFDRFWKDVALITEGDDQVVPAIASKYKVLFDRDIVEDLQSIYKQHPQICHSNSFVKGIEEGYVPYRYAQLLTVPRSATMMINNNLSLLLGSIVNYYMSLVNPADAEAFQEMPTRKGTTLSPKMSRKMSVTATLASTNDHGFETTRPRPEEEMTQLMAILRRAPTQVPPTAEVSATELTTLHPVAQCLFSRG
eukprot:Blabericola_migrator_1__1834@NODE_149_length_12902_cov_32_504636_g130_i0_p1_GENE_NODE_149_length_12902_cov_32_504636_g130_i0NODE_149_length_12902_cov_32_504636_g130_i0_p1_ORF_typecomplete_len1231_score227_54_NODE_149_length_12902_cov_32_504636_g130_i0886212554